MAAGEIDWGKGSAYVDGKVMPLEEAVIPITEWGYRRSDVTYDVVGVYFGAFFRLDDHIKRFRESMGKFRLDPRLTDDEIKQILMDLVKKTGLTEAYVAMDCLRGRPEPGKPYHPAYCRNFLAAHVRPWVWLFPEELQKTGIHTIIAGTPRIPADSVDPTAKNFHWGDLTAGNFEAFEKGAHTAILLDHQGNVTEGPGFNVFSITDGKVITPDHGVLGGITRMSVFELCQDMGIPCEVRAVPVEEFKEADEVFLATTAGGIMPVSRVDNRILGNDRPGPISMQLRETFWSKRKEGWHATPIDYAA